LSRSRSEAAFLAGLDECQDVGVVEPGGDRDLAKEALDADGAGERRVQQLDRNRAAEPDIGSEEHRRHSALAELALDGVPAGEDGLEPSQELGADVRGSHVSLGQLHP